MNVLDYFFICGIIACIVGIVVLLATQLPRRHRHAQNL
jgi:hypothetical protein